MADDFKTTIAQNLTGSVHTVAILVGTAFIVLALAGGITYQEWLPIQDSMARAASGIIGIGLIGFGLIASRSKAQAALKPRSFGVKIQFPAAGTQVNTVDVGGVIERELPDGYCLRVLRVYPGSNNFVPLSKARIDIHQKTWIAERCHIGGNKGDQRFYAACICGPSAEVLIAYHNEAAAVHRKTMDAYENATGSKADFLPTIAGRTADMYECDRVSVVRA